MENQELVIIPEEVKQIAILVNEKKREEVNNVLNQVFAGTSEWERQIESIIIKDHTDTMAIQMADTARLNIKKARLAAEKLFDAKRDEVQQIKSEYDLEDKLWLKSKQTTVLLFKAMEDKAAYKADTLKRYEFEQKEAQVQERLNKITKFNPEINRFQIENMTNEMFDLFFNGVEKDYNDKLEAERIAEEQRIAQIKAEEEAHEKMRLENERLRQESIIKDKRNNELRPYIVFIRDYNKMISLPEAEYQNELKGVIMGAELQWEYERQEALRIQKEAEAKEKQLAIERAEADAEKARLEAELQAKKDAEIAEQKRLEAIELAKQKESDKLAKAPIKKQLNTWIDTFQIAVPEQLQSNEIAIDIMKKFESFKTWAKTQTENI